MIPTDARPMPKAAMPCSQRGVLKTLCVPNFWFRSSEQRKTPPNFTSSPKRQALFLEVKEGIFSIERGVGGQSQLQGVVDRLEEVHLAPGKRGRDVFGCTVLEGREGPAKQETSEHSFGGAKDL